MNNKQFFELIAAADAFEPAERKDLEQALTLGCVLRATKAAMNTAQVLTLTVAKTLPESDKVIEIAYTQGRIAGMYEMLDLLCALTEENGDEK